MPFIYKIASTPQDMEAIFRLNYKTFVEEIPQHAPNTDKLLEDAYHDENTYLIGLDGTRLACMLALRDQRPFSMDGKQADFESLLPFRPKRMVEIRLLAVAKPYRSTRVLLGMMQFLQRYLQNEAYDMGIISGTTRELKLYRHLGFKPFGSLVGTAEAVFQPMYITRDSFESSDAYPSLRRDVRFLSGPVEIEDRVTRALVQRPLSHRSPAFARLLRSVQAKLCALTGSPAVELMLGGGTLAADAIAGQLQQTGGRGLIAVNGEFGRRLKTQAARWSLAYDAVEAPYGRPLPYDQLAEAAVRGGYRWLWAVHGETSTGVLNDLDRLKRIAADHSLRLALDCVSSLGAVPLDLRGVSLAGGVSGKALGAYTGLALLFHQDALAPAPGLPACIDAGIYEEAAGIPYSLSSSLVQALHAALDSYEAPDAVYERILLRNQWARGRLQQLGLRILAEREHQTSYILTIALPERIDSGELGRQMADQGFELQFESGYLLERNWIQIALLGKLKEKDVSRMLDTLAVFIAESVQSVINS